MAGRCTCCGRPADGRPPAIAEPLAQRLVARRRQLAAGGRLRGTARQEVVVRRAGPRAARRRWLAGVAVLAAAVLAVAGPPLLEPMLPLSWRAGCDICGIYVTARGAACERFFIDGDQPDRARYVNSCAARRPAAAEHVYRIHRREDDSFWLAPAAMGSEYRPVTFTKVGSDGELWRSDSPAMFADSSAGLFRRGDPREP